MAQLRQFLLESVQRLELEPEPEPKKKIKSVYNTLLVLYKTETKLSNILNLSPYYLFLFQTRTKDFSKFEKAIKKKIRSRDFLSRQMITLIQSSGIKPAQYVGFLKSHINFKDTNLMAD